MGGKASKEVKESGGEAVFDAPPVFDAPANPDPEVTADRDAQVEDAEPSPEFESASGGDPEVVATNQGSLEHGVLIRPDTVIPEVVGLFKVEKEQLQSKKGSKKGSKNSQKSPNKTSLSSTTVVDIATKREQLNQRRKQEAADAKKALLEKAAQPTTVDYSKQLAKIKKIQSTHPGNLACKFFDEEYFAALDEAGKAGLMKCIASGIENADSGMGCYANQPSDYDTYQPFFCKVLAQYHNVDEGATHVNNWSLSEVEGLPEGGSLDLKALGLPELSMRVRVGRNLKDFPLPGAMTKSERIELENKMCGAFDVLKNMPEFGGKYNSLTPGHTDYRSPMEYQKLVNDHVMFKDMSADPYLETAGIASDWPHGRGCYQSSDKKFIIWVGEEDHIRIMCMYKGTLLNGVFDRLKAAIDTVNAIDGINFAISEQYGVVTSCPTNLGTAMRASVHIPIPSLTQDGSDKKAKSICKPLGLSVRGLGGEHTAIGKDGTCDISPSARFCITEAEIIAKLYSGLQALQNAEQAALSKIQEVQLQKEAKILADPKVGPFVERLSKINAIKISHPDNLACKNFDQSYFDTLSIQHKEGLLKCMASGIENPDSGMGCYANQPADYETYKPFFSKVLSQYHQVDEDAVHVTNWELDPKKKVKGGKKAKLTGMPPDGQLDLEKLGLPSLSMRVRVGRNLKDFPLPGAMTMENRVELEKKMCKAFNVLAAMPQFGGAYNSLTPGHVDFRAQREYRILVEKHLMFKDMSADPYLVSAGIASDWPYGRGCYVSDDSQFIVWVGEEDHLRIMCMYNGTSLNDVFGRLKAALDVIEAIPGLKFAKSSQYGFVTSCPTNLGTGMRASVHIPLPFLTRDGTDQKAKAVCKPLGLSVRGTGGEHTPIGQDGTCDISPSARFCIMEAEIICSLYVGLKALYEKESKGHGAGVVSIQNTAPIDANAEILEKIVAIQKSHPGNLACRYFTRKYYDSLSEAKKAGLLKIMASGIAYPDAEMGCFANLPDDYETYHPFFSKVIAAFHKVTEKTEHESNWSLKKSENKKLKGVPADGILDIAKLGLPSLSIRVRVCRNLRDFPMSAAMTKADRIRLEDKMYPAFEVLMKHADYGGDYHSLTPGHKEFRNDEEYKQLVTDRLMFKNMASDKQFMAAGIAADWPYGRGCYVSEDELISIWLGEEDHLRIQCFGSGTVLNDAFDRLKTALDMITSMPGGTFRFKMSNKFGNVTSCPTNLGTAMRASVLMPLPKLCSGGNDAKVKLAASKLGLAVRGTGGDGTAVGEDGTCDISPNARFGVSEAEVLAALYTGVKEIHAAEDKAKK